MSKAAEGHCVIDVDGDIEGGGRGRDPLALLSASAASSASSGVSLPFPTGLETPKEDGSLSSTSSQNDESNSNSRRRQLKESRKESLKESFANQAQQQQNEQQPYQCNRSNSKFLIVFVLIALLSAVAAYFTIWKKESSLFRRQFPELADILLEDFYETSCQRHQSIKKLSTYLHQRYDSIDFTSSSEKKLSADEWNSLVKLTMSRGETMVVAYSPILKTEEEHAAWEAYVLSTSADTTSYSLNEVEEDYGNSLTSNPVSILGEIRETRKEEQPLLEPTDILSEVEVPFWYIFRAEELIATTSDFNNSEMNVSAVMNSNGRIVFYKDQISMGEERKEALEQLITGKKLEEDFFYSKIFSKESNESTTSSSPRSVLYYPVFKPDRSGTGNSDSNLALNNTYASNDTNKLAGTVSFELDWEKSLFQSKSYPNMMNGIYIILENSAGEKNTFRIKNGTVEFCGIGGKPQDTYEDMLITSNFSSFHSLCSEEQDQTKKDNTAGQGNNGKGIGENSTAEDGTKRIEYRIHLYPSANFENHYKTNYPVMFAVGAAVLCIICIILFLSYDCIMQRRQQKSLKVIEGTNAVVNSLFPASIRERLNLVHEDSFTGSAAFAMEDADATKADRGGSGALQLLPSTSPVDSDKKQGQESMEFKKDGGRVDKMTAINKSNRRISFRDMMNQGSFRGSIRSSFRSNSSTNSRKSVKSKLPEPPKAKLKSFLNETLGDGERKNIDNSNSSVNSFNKLTSNGSSSQPIADFFPHTTVMFADISGFTAWSSEREPVDVFRLLETLFLEFDSLLTYYNVFKVETMGDCYVAVTGLPEPSKDHAVRLSRFASECILVMNNVCQRLESSLGPGTGDLTLRVGLHSGSVTAGVLRGEKLRFQLFGDTVNTAARIESHSKDNMIQCSQATADLLNKAGKGHWLTPREDPIQVKGKGVIQTYWCRPTRKLPAVGDHRTSMLLRTGSMRSLDSEYSSHNSSSVLGQNSSQCSDLGRAKDWGNTSVDLFIQFPRRLSREDKRRSRETQLITWNVKILATALEKVVARRQAMEQIMQASAKKDAKRKRNSFKKRDSRSNFDNSSCLYQELTDYDDDALCKVDEEPMGEIAPFKEVTEIIELSNFDQKIANHDTSFNNYQSRSSKGLLSEAVLRELRDYVSRIARMYNNVPFHNLEHASHVTMSASKLMNRIVTPEGADYYQNEEEEDVEEEEDEALKEYELKLAERIHYSTFGISSDPLAQFAIIFSALVHDVEHTGLTNAELVRKKDDVAIKYDGVSVAEQNSVAIAWNLLMEPCFSELRKAMFITPQECSRFRRLVVNTVMATDIIDKELQRLRKNRWKKAFHETTTNDNPKNPEEEQDTQQGSETATTILNRKATIVIEHIIQASDVAHTMQHWHIYTKWNEKFFHERYKAYLNGIEDEDPSLKWYESEMGFFDHYIIPLAYKLKECGVFGVSCDEYLGFALENRLEWELKGVQVVKDMLKRAKTNFSIEENDEKEEENDEEQMNEVTEGNGEGEENG